jgi:hypothetical protein
VVIWSVLLKIARSLSSLHGRPTIGYNGLQLQEVGDFYHKCSYEERMFD